MGPMSGKLPYKARDDKSSLWYLVLNTALFPTLHPFPLISRHSQGEMFAIKHTSSPSGDTHFPPGAFLSHMQRKLHPWRWCHQRWPKQTVKTERGAFYGFFLSPWSFKPRKLTGWRCFEQSYFMEEMQTEKPFFSDEVSVSSLLLLIFHAEWKHLEKTSFWY